MLCQELISTDMIIQVLHDNCYDEINILNRMRE